MSKNGLTMTIVFVAESANYGEGLGNISNIKKMTRGNASQYSYISRQAIRYNIVQQAEWDNTPVEDKSGVVQFAPSATIEDYPEIDLFGYMKTMAKDDNARGGASTRSAVARLSNAISLEPYQGELEFLTNMGLAKRQNLDNGIAQSEIHRSYYAYTISVDLDRVGIDGEINVSKEEKAKRVKILLETVQYLYRDIRGRREDLKPLFIIGGVYDLKNPLFENAVRIKKNKVVVESINSVLENKEIRDNTFVGMVSGIFENDNEVREKLDATNINSVIESLQKKVSDYYEGN